MRSRAQHEGAGVARQGLALPLVLASMVLIGILSASGLYLARQDRRAADNAVLAEQALAAAELALGEAIEGWDGEGAGALAVGSAWHREVPVVGAVAELRVTRLSSRTFWAVAEGRASRGSSWSRRRLNAVLRAAVPPVAIDAALTSGGPLELAQGAIVAGGAGIPCDSGEPPVPAAGLAVRELADAGGHLGAVSGDPAVRTGASGVGPFATGSAAHAWIAQRATVVVPGGSVPRPSRPSLSAERCDASDPGNWGEPRPDGVAECAAYRRLVHATGDLRLEGAHRGQGILLVDGDLAVPGRLEFRGLVIVGGRLDAEGELRVEGAVLIGAAGPVASRLGAGVLVQYAQCDVDRALTSAGHPVLAGERGWADLF